VHFAGLGLGLGKICNQIQFQFSLHIRSVLFRPYDILQTRIVHTVTQAKIPVTYLIFTAELTHGLACFYSCSEDLDLTWTWLLLDLMQVC